MSVNDGEVPSMEDEKPVPGDAADPEQPRRTARERIGSAGGGPYASTKVSQEREREEEEEEEEGGATDGQAEG